MQSARSQNPALEAKIRQMALPLAPLVRLTTGDVHPIFPSTLLNFWLLTSEQCDELAHFYHQRTPSAYTRHYPCPVEWKTDATLDEKRRRIGRFIGLRGCESPVRVLSEEEILRSVREERERAGEEEKMRGKTRWY
ncbi:beta-xylosidase [Drepanopeziza brunnea f. sp. 'multigermtubi' MB_m1]|uniref:Beta-xylosidase n=2 Tax=Drepanopeziza brunnea f. sp. 'multigermtubi' TaxID=698441 RepID=K1XJ61_MARBU|nr:beta-xylosidase [Drepanopeziza brunnea f. sp. 'multigermtubi' MB_m1]EKD20723.1 beta-xylosidase [Drepanopeziza brunnea f. sp. 'multigermtubi' MB_m1]